jgi:hypothetical protein
MFSIRVSLFFLAVPERGQVIAKKAVENPRPWFRRSTVHKTSKEIRFGPSRGEFYDAHSLVGESTASRESGVMPRSPESASTQFVLLVMGVLSFRAERPVSSCALPFSYSSLIVLEVSITQFDGCVKQISRSQRRGLDRKVKDA